MLFLHGMLGRGTNWQSFARRFVERCPQWSAVLVDLRMHGRSQGFPPPHTLHAAAGDVAELCDSLELPVRGVLGHSFGGKVALRWLEHASGVEESWLVDTPPGPRERGEGDDTIGHVLATLKKLPSVYAHRTDFVAALQAEDIPKAIALWLAQNLEHEEGGMRLRIDFDAMDALLQDHLRSDLWPVVDALPESHRLHFVVGERSRVFLPRERELARQRADAGTLALHVIENAGHWVHAEAPDALLACMVGSDVP